MRALKLFRRSDERPDLKSRLAGLKLRLGRVARKPAETDPQRRAMLAGSVASAIPLPALAVTASIGPHPDAELLAAGERYERAIAAVKAAEAAYDEAWAIVQPVLETYPPEVVCAWSDRCMILGGARWPTLVGGNLRWLPTGKGEPMREGWTGKVLRNAIRQAVSRLGKGGQTPHHVRRWKALLPTVDSFDLKMETVETATDYRQKSESRIDAREKLRDAMNAIRTFEATTPEGLAFLARVCALDHERGCFISPNLLRSAANVAGIDLTKVSRPWFERP